MVTNNTQLLIIHLVTMTAVLCLGVFSRHSVAVPTAVIAFVTNFAIHLPEGGPGLLAGTFAYPLVYLCIAGVGRALRLLLLRVGILTEPPAPLAGPRCIQCGYLLIGLPDNTCPECGQRFEDKPEQEQTQ